MTRTVTLGFDVGVGSADGRAVAATVTAAENAGFGYVTFDDDDLATGGVDAVTRAAFVAATTSTVGLVATASTTYAEPFHLSSQLASLDYASRGRAGWVASRSLAPDVAAAWGREVVSADTDLVREQRDSVTVARGLWDSWEDDAVIRDFPTGRFLNQQKLHYVDFVGEEYSVKGPAIVPRPPQGQVVVFGRFGEIDADLLDVVLVENEADARAVTGAHVVLDVEAPGSPTAAAALVERIAALDDAIGGIRLRPDLIDDDLRVAARYVLPQLFERDLAHRPVPATTLRSTLGLARPVNRFEAAR
ncbi:LLM class flavin-dependent oxidoreductase [Rhodococcus sp. BP-316]|uniref:LLM class flavin-dependent oxidoreductase n=1 Tax=unclassified Rhodococcus (in: high G+C Gram-positive bacteria) TaxID=192944 RepID=UPI001C9B1E86|nr:MULTISPECIES: LLM class flavin-dependent oxidoreductase [unclassified Rhodococcus (in: high G+C Gram-positive bacteria)]MBY6680414.1 LLM class flavin-dependent oxidoreductase [Rhodococcus sp. BP-316]MDQ1199929.1 alkanesulfonate monooxygenase SsuD/methylene tetrahydromethanopterin reductase-like flavin-dependent oxidoreductase (luciferase family) [Rhodococcus sp. SORGH_AS_0303]